MEKRLTKIREYTQAALDILLVMKVKFALLEPLMKSEILINRLSGGLRVKARNIMISTLYLDCSLSLLAISIDSCEKAASICNVLRLLKTEDLRSYLRNEFATPRTIYDFSDIQEEAREQLAEKWQQQEQVILLNKFDETYQNIKNDFSELKDGEVCLRLKMVRDKVHAHKEMCLDDGYPRLRTLEEFGVKVGDLGFFMDSVEKLLLKLEEIVNRSSTSFDIIKNQSTVMAKEFWQIEIE
jgi:hypothetical protein